MMSMAKMNKLFYLFIFFFSEEMIQKRRKKRAKERELGKV
jgi:hypothetical protein